MLDLQILRDFLLGRGVGLKLAVGDATEPDGTCFLHSIRQNMLHLEKKGLWSGIIPDSAEELRSLVIQFMSANRKLWTRPCYNMETGMYQDPPLDDVKFNDLIEQQAKPHTWTDKDGYFVQGCCVFLDIQLHIVLPNIPGPILESGLGGPYQIINKSFISPEEQHVFYVGLIQDGRDNGHYQFLYKIDGEELDFPALRSGKFTTKENMSSASLLIPIFLSRNNSNVGITTYSDYNFTYSVSNQSAENSAITFPKQWAENSNITITN